MTGTPPIIHPAALPGPKEFPLIEVELSAAEITIEPGGTAQLTITVHNRQEHDDHVSLEIEGIDVEWYALPVPTLNIPANTSQSARALFKIARASSSHAGTYPFLVRAKGMESGDSGVQQATLVITPFSSLQLELNPKRITSTVLHRTNVVDVTVTNLGNREETLDLYASDPEDACAYDFETDRVTVKPGHAESTPLQIEPVTRPVIGSNRLYGFTVTARSVLDSYVSGSAHGQLERRPFLSALMAAVLLLLIVGASVLALLQPRPVALNSFTANPMSVIEGQPVTLAWNASNFAEGYILPDNVPIRSAAGTISVTPTATTTYKLVVKGGGKQAEKEVTILVEPKKAPPRARITALDASAKKVHQGETVTLSWKGDGAVSMVLNPLGISIDPKLQTSQQVTPDTTTTYELRAKGADGDVVTKSVKVEVVPPGTSIAEINGFKAKPDKILPGEKVTLSWSVSNAASAEIDNGVGSVQKSGNFAVTPTVTTIYTLRAIDNKGNVTTKSVTVTVMPPEQPEGGTDPNTSPAGGPTPPGGGGGNLH
jgi:hypothetical protein